MATLLSGRPRVIQGFFLRARPVFSNPHGAVLQPHAVGFALQAPASASRSRQASDR
jgi:hypothetical protein